MFEKPALVDQFRDGGQPRKFTVLLPALDFEGSPIAHKVDPFDADSDMVGYRKQMNKQTNTTNTTSPSVDIERSCERFSRR